MADETGLLPGMEVVWRPGDGATFDVSRREANGWEIAVAPPDVRVFLQVDDCGTWCTFALADGQRPVVVRRAGWVDLRGQPAEEGRVAFDRVGLGPGDSVVVTAGAPAPSVAQLDALLEVTGEPAEAIADAVPDAAAVLVLRVPEFDDGLARAVGATGLPASAFATPLHPVGSPAAELWDRRPTPPAEARMRLEPVAAAVPMARSLLRRLMASWRMAELLDGDLELLATELLTNAVLHARTAMRVVIAYDGAAVRFEVHDASPVLPVAGTPDDFDERGRGLWLIDELSSRWAVEPTPGGKRIWFEVAA